MTVGTQEAHVAPGALGFPGSRGWWVCGTVSHAPGPSVLAPDKQTLYDLASLGPHSRPGCPAPVSPEDLAGLAWTLSPGAAVTGQRPHR